MPVMSGVFRLGRDAEVRYLPSGEAVASMSVAYNYGKKGDNGHRPSQWLDVALWGDRAEKLAQYLLKGTAVELVIEDLHMETYKGRDGDNRAKITGRVLKLEFAGGRSDEAGQERQAPARPAPPPAASRPPVTRPASTGSGFDDMDDDIPF